MFDCYNISYTDYIRTTEDRHKYAVQKFWVSNVKLGILGLGYFTVDNSTLRIAFRFISNL